MWWVNLASYTFILIIGAPKYSRTINNTVSHIEQNFQSNNSKYLYSTYCVSGIIPRVFTQINSFNPHNDTMRYVPS